MSCDIPNSYPSKFLPNIPDFYNGVNDGIEHLRAKRSQWVILDWFYQNR